MKDQLIFAALAPHSLLKHGVRLLAFITVAATLASAAVVRGRVVHQSQSPATGIAVTLYSPTSKRTVPVHTDANGAYYIPNVSAGNYSLEIWTSTGPGTKPIEYSIRVDEPYTDVAARVIP